MLVADRGSVGCGSRGMGRCVPCVRYGYDEGTMVAMVGVGGRNGGVCGLEVCSAWEA